MDNKPARSKPVKHEKTSRGKFSEHGSEFRSEVNDLEGKRRRSSNQQRLATNKIHYSFRH